MTSDGPNKRSIKRRVVTPTADDRSSSYERDFIASRSGGDEIFSSYEDYVSAKRQRNLRVLQSSGLLRATSEFRTATAATPSPRKGNRKAVTKRVSKRHTTIKPSRRSTRKTGKPPLYSGEDIDALDRRVSRVVQKRKKGRSTSAGANGPRASTRLEFTATEREKLKKSEGWLSKFNDFLLTVPHGNHSKTISDTNARTVMRQVRALASGSGVGYHHWPKRVLFAKNRPIDLSADFDELYREAVEYEDRYGRDLGNGWLLRHPIVKMQCYQSYLLSLEGLSV